MDSQVLRRIESQWEKGNVEILKNEYKKRMPFLIYSDVPKIR